MTASFAVAVPSASWPVEGGRHRRAGAVALVGALLLLAAQVQGWAWPQDHAGGSGGATPAAAEAPARPVTHGLEPVAGSPGTFDVHDNTYTGRFDPAGFAYTPTGASAPLRVGLSSIERGGVASPLELGAWTGEANVAERPVGAGITERVTAGNGSIEWDVVLASPPAGRGDLAVAASLDGAQGPPTQVDTGNRPAWRFALSGGQSVQVDEMAVRDAHGVELYRALPNTDGTNINLQVPDAVLQGAAYPLVIDPVVRSSFTIQDTDFGCCFGSSSNPRIAWSNTGNYGMVVWRATVQGNNYILARLVFYSGVYGNSPIIIQGISGPVGPPDIAYNGTNFLVVWAQGGKIQASNVADSYATTAAGPVFPVAPAPFNNAVQSEPAVTGVGGGASLVVWTNQTSENNTDIYGTQVRSDNRVVTPTGLPIANSSASEHLADPATNNATTTSPSTVLVAWQNTTFDTCGQFGVPCRSENIQARQTTLDGFVMGTAPTVLTNTLAGRSENPAVASDGSGFFVVWDSGSGTAKDINGGLVNRSGARTSAANGFTISNAVDAQTQPAVAFNVNYLVVWADRRFQADSDIFANRVTTGGNVKNGTGFQVSGAVGPDEDAPTVSTNNVPYTDGSAGFFVGNETNTGTSSTVIIGHDIKTETSPK